MHPLYTKKRQKTRGKGKTTKNLPVCCFCQRFLLIFVQFIQMISLFFTLKNTQMHFLTQDFQNFLPRHAISLGIKHRRENANPHASRHHGHISQRSYFTWRSHISRPKGISQIPQGIYFVEKSTCFRKCFFSVFGIQNDNFLICCFYVREYGLKHNLTKYT